jgi:ubiquitin carboxyl-terminal hydrolase 5/13
MLHCQGTKLLLRSSFCGCDVGGSNTVSVIDMITCLLSDIDVPVSQGAHGNEVDQSKVDTLLSFGFQEEIARKALKASVKICFLFFQA